MEKFEEHKELGVKKQDWNNFWPVIPFGTASNIANSPGEDIWLPAPGLAINRRPETATTSNYVGRGDLEGVKYTKLETSIYSFMKAILTGFFSSLSTASEIIHCLTFAFLLTK